MYNTNMKYFTIIYKVKKLISYLLVFVCLGLILTTRSLASDLCINTYLGGRSLKTTNPPLVRDEQIYLPLRDLMYEAGLQASDITWDQEDRSVLVSISSSQKDDYFELNIGDHHVNFNSNKLYLSCPPIIENDRTYCSFDFYQLLNEMRPGFLSYLNANAKDAGGNLIIGYENISVEDVISARNVIRSFLKAYQTGSQDNLKPFVTDSLRINPINKNLLALRIKDLQIGQNHLIQDAYIKHKANYRLNSSNVLVFKLDFEASFLNKQNKLVFEDCIIVLNKVHGTWLIDKFEI